MDETISYIHYYCREGLWRHLQKLSLINICTQFCTETLNRRGSDPVYVFWRTFGLLMEGSHSDALRELDGLRFKKETAICSLMALVAYHKTSSDKDAYNVYLTQLQQEEPAASNKALFHAALYCFHSQLYEKGREHTRKIIENDPQFPGVQSLRGWIDLCCGRENIILKANSFFEAALSAEGSEKKDIDARYGLSRYYQHRGQYVNAIDTLTEAIVIFPNYQPFMIEKARVLLMNGDWDQLKDLLKRILSKEATNIEALKLSTLREMVREGKPASATMLLSDVMAAIDRILKHTVTMIERAISLSPDDAKLYAELAFQQILFGNLPESIKNYQKALKLDDSNIQALHGLIKCQILENKLEDAEEQLQFLAELEVSIGKSPETTYLRALLSLKKNENIDISVQNLDTAVDLHLKSLKSIPMGLKFYSIFNPEFLFECARELFSQIGNEPLENAELQKPLIMQVSKTLDILSKYTPGIVEVYLSLGRARYVLGDFDAALRYLQQALKIDASSYSVHLLMSQVHLQQDRFKQASQSLELALSQSFEVRDSAVYHLTNAKIQDKLGNLSEALRIMENTMLLSGIKKSNPRSAKSKFVALSEDERCNVYLFYISILVKANQVVEASKVIQEAKLEFSGSPQEVRIVIADAQLLVRKGETDGAIKILRSIPADTPSYSKAQLYLANIYLTAKKDNRNFIRIYSEIASKINDTNSFLMLGDAFMKIQEPEKAIEKYEMALSRNPSDSSLASKIGQVYIDTHDYKRAIEFYEKAVRSDPGKLSMKYDLAQLYVRIRKFDMAEQTLNQALQHPRDNDDTVFLLMDVKMLLLLAKVYRNSRSHQKAVDCLTKARDYQSNILSRSKGDSLEFVVEQKRVAAQVMQALGSVYEEQKVKDKAIEAFKEALQYDDANEKVMASIAALHLSRGDFGECQRQCNAIIRIDPANEVAMSMIAEVMFQKKEYESATFHYQQLLQTKPDQYHSLAKLTGLLRRAGKLSDVERFHRLAESKSGRAVYEPGYQFCKGLFHRYSNNPAEALNCFNHARKNGEWGEMSLVHMIEIYLNPDNEFAFEEGDESKADNTDSLKSAEKLLRELGSFAQGSRYHILESYLMMASKSKTSIDAVIQKLTDILTVEKDSVPALLALSTAHILQKQQPKARNHLKRIAKMDYDFRDAEEFEKSWVLLANIYIEGGKYDLAQELLKRVTSNNRSSAKAWELLGFIMEKEQSYRDAADNYELAWKYSGQSNPAIGFKLAFNYMKDKRYVSAIDICHTVLDKYPNYPKIKKEIMEKARANLRP